MSESSADAGHQHLPSNSLALPSSPHTLTDPDTTLTISAPHRSTSTSNSHSSFPLHSSVSTSTQTSALLESPSTPAHTPTLSNPSKTSRGSTLWRSSTSEDDFSNSYSSYLRFLGVSLHSTSRFFTLQRRKSSRGSTLWRASPSEDDFFFFISLVSSLWTLTRDGH